MVLSVETFGHAGDVDRPAKVSTRQKEIVGVLAGVRHAVLETLGPRPPAETAVGVAHKAVKRSGRTLALVAGLLRL